MRRFLFATLFFLVLVAIWHFLVKAGVYSPVLLPSPQSVGEYLSARRETAPYSRRLVLRCAGC